MNVPATPGYERSSSACQATAYGTSTSFAPNARMRSSLAAGAVSMATTVHGTPAARAAYATPWPALPALIHSGQAGADLRHLIARCDDIARFTQRRLARVDEDARRGDEIVVQLAPVGAGCADRIDVRPGREPASLQDGRRRACRDDNDVRAADGIRRRGHGLHAMPLGERRRVSRTPHAHFLE